MRGAWGLLSLVGWLSACGDVPAGEEAHVLDGVEVADDGKGDSLTGTTGEVIPLVIENGAVPGTAERPNVVAYIPAGLDTSEGLHVVVYFHGHMNCAANVLKARNSACRAGYGAREAQSLARQLADSKKNAILLVPELAYDAADSHAFALEDDYRFAWLLWDSAEALSEKLGGAGYWDIDQVIVAAHSGGYQAAAATVRAGGVDVSELWILDGLYGMEGDFDAWIAAEHDLLAGTPRQRRFADVYTGWAGTLGLSQQLAARQKPLFAPAAVLDDRTGATLTPAQYDRALLFKRSGLSHDDVPRYYFRKLLETSRLPDKS